MVELFHEVSFQVELGQTFDMLAAPQDGTVDLDGFSMEKYNSIVTYKTAYYTFYLLVALALLYTGRASPRNLKQAEEVLWRWGRTSRCRTTISKALRTLQSLAR